MYVRPRAASRVKQNCWHKVGLSLLYIHRDTLILYGHELKVGDRGTGG